MSHRGLAQPPGSGELDQLVARALAEDVRGGDVTTLWTVPEDRRCRASIIARGPLGPRPLGPQVPLVVAGLDAVVRTFLAVDDTLDVRVLLAEGEAAGPDREVVRVSGRLRSVLTAERTALNFLGRLSGIATLTRSFVERVSGTGAQIVDTRKTTPGWRSLEKRAVRAGGGGNHRMGLYDMVLIKENHIAGAGGLVAAVQAVQRANSGALPVELEVTSLDELDMALPLGVDRILLDNMSLEDIRTAVTRTRSFGGSPPELEASGNVTLERVRAVAETGVDLISVGALTHSAPTADYSLLVGDLDH